MFPEKTCCCILTLASTSLLLEGRIVASHNQDLDEALWRLSGRLCQYLVCMLLMYKDLTEWQPCYY